MSLLLRQLVAGRTLLPENGRYRELEIGNLNSDVWDASLLALDYPTLALSTQGYKIEDGQRGQVREALGA